MLTKHIFLTSYRVELDTTNSEEVTVVFSTTLSF